MSNITKSGIILCNEFDESNAMYIAKTNSQPSYTPGTGTNSCMNALNVKFDYADTTIDTVYRVIAKVTYSGFDNSNTSGTFKMWWQDANYNTANATYEWQGTNYVVAALNNQMNVTTLVLSAANGSYIYDTTFTLPQSFRNTWSGSQIGFRSDYSNGTGKITITELMVLPDKYSSTGSTKVHLGDDFIACREFMEV